MGQDYKEVNFHSNIEAGDVYEVECVVGAFHLGVRRRTKLQKQNMVSNMNEIIKRRWDEGVVLRKRLSAQGRCI